jgi:UPF0755 protein
MIRRAKYIALFLSIVLLSVVLLFCSVWYRPLAQSGSVIVSPNMTLSQLAFRLQSRGFLHYPRSFIVIAQYHGMKHRLRVGQYRIDAKMSLRQLMDNITQAKGMVQHHITFIEGTTLLRILQQCHRDANLDHYYEKLTLAQKQQLFSTQHQSLEGLFFPDTYQFVWGNSDVVILQQARKKMQQILAQQWQQRATGLPYKNPYQALIVASLIESESPRQDERPIVASVVINRLKKRMRLQIDPTVIYAMHKQYGTRLQAKDLRYKSRYNTYLHYGLPPSPINMPSLGSIHAALHPAHTDYYYYVAKGNGRHAFSRTYRGQKLAINEYLRRPTIRTIVPWRLPQLQEYANHHVRYMAFLLYFLL